MGRAGGPAVGRRHGGDRGARRPAGPCNSGRGIGPIARPHRGRVARRSGRAARGGSGLAVGRDVRGIQHPEVQPGDRAERRSNAKDRDAAAVPGRTLGRGHDRGLPGRVGQGRRRVSGRTRPAERAVSWSHGRAWRNGRRGRADRDGQPGCDLATGDHHQQSQVHGLPRRFRGGGKPLARRDRQPAAPPGTVSTTSRRRPSWPWPGSKTAWTRSIPRCRPIT